jgi:hypothetical protein
MRSIDPHSYATSLVVFRSKGIATSTKEEICNVEMAEEFRDAVVLRERGEILLVSKMLHLQPWARLQRMCAPSLSGSTPVLFHNFPQQRQQRSLLLHDGRRYAAVVIRSCASSARPSPWLLVGLGNPGSKYQGTRHNVGFEMIDAIAQAENISLTTIQHKALLGKGYVGGVPVLLAKPQTYMNLSGESVGPLSTYYKIPVERVLVVCISITVFST